MSSFLIGVDQMPLSMEWNFGSMVHPYPELGIIGFVYLHFSPKFHENLICASLFIGFVIQSMG